MHGSSSCAHPGAPRRNTQAIEACIRADLGGVVTVMTVPPPNAGTSLGEDSDALRTPSGRSDSPESRPSGCSEHSRVSSGSLFRRPLRPLVLAKPGPTLEEVTEELASSTADTFARSARDTMLDEVPCLGRGPRRHASSRFETDDADDLGSRTRRATAPTHQAEARAPLGRPRSSVPPGSAHLRPLSEFKDPRSPGTRP